MGIDGGGGAPPGAEAGIGGGGGGLVGPLPTAGLAGVELLPVADEGRGGPMVPKRMDARWRALPAPGPSSSEESSSLSEPTTDHSSSSGRARETRPEGCDASGSAALGASWVTGRRWKGLLDTAAGVPEVEDVSLAWASFFKKGFFVSVSGGGLATGRLEFRAGVGIGGTKVGTGGGGGKASFCSSS